jgi:hypothetical protein
MSYLKTVSELRAVAAIVNPDGTFDHGKKVDFSQNFDKPFPAIFLYPFEIRDPEDSFLDTSTLTLGFWMQDRPDTSVYERETIIGQMDLLCTAFMTQLKTNNLISVTGVVREPQYQFHQATVSGFAVRFQYQNFTPCVDP